MEIKISVVIPTYNRPQLLQKCLLNIINQSFNKNEYEIIVVSDGPDEITKTKVLEYKKQGAVDISFLSLPNKKDPAAARNFGWRATNGLLIAVTDDDCLPETNWLKEIWEAYNNETEIVYTGKLIVPISKHPTDFELNTAKLETGEFVTANCTCTKKALVKVQGFDERFKVAWREDSDLHFKLLENNIPIFKNENAIVIHPVRKANWGISIKEQKKSMFNALLYKKHRLLFKQRIKTKPTWLYYRIIVLFITGIILLFCHYYWLSIIMLFGWIALTTAFIIKRLRGTSHSFSHITEMVATSFIIPFLSVFWTLVGAIKYRVLFF